MNTQVSHTIQSDSDLVADLDETLPNSARYLRVLNFSIIAVLLGFPFFFGGVHSTSNLPIMVLFFGLLLFGLVFQPDLFAKISLKHAPVTCLILSCLGFFAIYLLIQPVLLNDGVEHPLGLHQLTAQWMRSIESLCWLSFVAVTFLLVSVLTLNREGAAIALLRILLWSGILVGLTGLAHWFYDNGKLFWTFSPDYMFSSDRARWPFVNSDHYAHYLLICFFPAVIEAKSLTLNLVERIRVLQGREQAWLSVAALDKRVQRLALRLLVPVIAAIICALGILASLSRGAWLGLAVGVFLLVVQEVLFSRPATSEIGERQGSLSSPSRNRHRHRRRRFAVIRDFFRATLDSRIGRAAIPLILISLATVYFLNERGTELVGGRIEYGLLHSKDDIRFELYRDTWPIFLDHPLLGVGAGGWEEKFPRYMNPLLAGLGHNYLHSDPLQLLVEFGVIGVLPLLIAVGGVAYYVFRLRMNLRGYELMSVNALVSALVALIVAASFDFPFRIPAILIQAFIVFSLLCALLDEAVGSRCRARNSR